MSLSDRLAEIETRIANATRAPWIESANQDPDGSMSYGIATEHDEADVCTFPYTPQGSEDMELVAHARDDLAALVAVVREVEALHREIAGPEDATTCATCIELDHGEGETPWDYTWPCPTAAAVQKLDQ